VISNLQANIHEIVHVRNDMNIPVGLSRVNISLETRGYDHIDKVMDTLSQHYEVTRLV
jgi:threonine dehydratase